MSRPRPCFTRSSMSNIGREDLLDVPVIHPKYGRGVIAELADDTIVIQFRKERKRFVFPDVFDEHLKFDQRADAERLQALIDDVKLGHFSANSKAAFIGQTGAGLQPSAEESLLEAEIREAVSLFDDFKLTEESKSELAKYFRYRARRLPTSASVHYNFFVHSVDRDVTRRFTSLFSNVCHYFDPNIGKTTYEQATPQAARVLPSRDDTVSLYSDTAFLSDSDIEKGPQDNIHAKTIVIINSSAPWHDADQRPEDLARKKHSWESFVQFFCERNPAVCKLLCVPEKLAQSCFRNNERLYFYTFSHHIYFERLSVEDVKSCVARTLTDRHFRLSPDFKAALDQYIATVYPNSDLQGLVFTQDLANRIAANYYGSARDDMQLKEVDIPVYQKTTSNLRPLDTLVGLDSIKKKIVELEALMRFRQKGTALGIHVDDVQLHMVFAGNPGTGKTTVARAIADILYQIGAIQKNKVTEVTRKNLCADYLGQTATKTSRVIEDAVGGILFVDEAYALATDDYGREAIETIMTAMENRRKELMVIFAGYEDEMKNFVDSNPGIRSRIGYTFHFEDYSSDDLHEIFCRQLDSQGFSCTVSAGERAKSIWKKGAGVNNAGNGRFVRKVMQEVVIKHAARIAGTECPTQNDFKTITEADIPSLEEVSELLLSSDTKRIIGFSGA